MRTAILSDIHGNLTAFEAVLRDLRETAPDRILHGGDLADGGAAPAEIVDRIRGLGWSGVAGNTDEMLAAPAAFEDFAAGLPHLGALFAAVREMAAFTREALGADRLAWLAALPRVETGETFALVHASPGSLWHAPLPEVDNSALEMVYGTLARPLVVYGHIHRPFVRALGAFTLANAGSVGQPHDGDPRASYLLVDDGRPSLRRVPYDVERESARLAASGLPHAAWAARMLAAARPEMP